MSRPTRLLASLLSWAALLVVSGCSGGPDLPETVPVTGTVMYQGEPLAGATVTFRNSEQGARPATAITDDNGAFQLTTFEEGDGAVPGKHVVTVTKMADSGGGSQGTEQSMEEAAAAAEQGEEQASAEPQSAIPERYGNPDTSDLSYTVKEGETNEFTIELEG